MCHALLGLANAMYVFPSTELTPLSLSACTAFTSCSVFFLSHLDYQSLMFQFSFHWLLGHQDSFSSTIHNFPMWITSLFFFFFSWFDAKTCSNFPTCSLHCIQFESNSFVPKALYEPRANPWVSGFLFSIPICNVAAFLCWGWERRYRCIWGISVAY